MSRRDRRQGFPGAAGDIAPRTVLGVTPPSLPQGRDAAPEMPLAGVPVARTVDDAHAVDDPPAPPVVRYRARVMIFHSGRRFDAGSEIPAEAASEMIACGLRVGVEIFKG